VSAVVLALTVSGCGTREAGAAAVVGERRISVAAVQDAYQDILPLVGQDQQISQAQILNLLILEPYLTQAAAAQGRGISAEDTRQNMKSAGMSDPSKVSYPAVEVWRANLANTAVQSDRPAEAIKATYEDIGRKLKKAGVRINPRYGAGLDYTNFSILPGKPNWLAAPAAPSAQTPNQQSPDQQSPDQQSPDQQSPDEQPAPGATPTP
jgi:hypothetical protein